MMRQDIFTKDQRLVILRSLEEQGLITLARLNNNGKDFFVATITQRGLDVAQGRAFVDGVKKPSPKI